MRNVSIESPGQYFIYIYIYIIIRSSWSTHSDKIIITMAHFDCIWSNTYYTHIQAYNAALFEIMVEKLLLLLLLLLLGLLLFHSIDIGCAWFKLFKIV